MSFKNIINQDQIIDFLQSSYRLGRMAGAYLFLGREGSGQCEVAREYAKLLNCDEPSDNPCDQCPSCEKIGQDSHPDIHWYCAVNRTIPISLIRELEKYMYLKPYEAKRKVFIIKDAHYLTEESSNALLKTLEEPARDSLIILIATDARQLLPTILSRCQKMIFNAFDEKYIHDILTKKYRIPLSKAHFFSYFSEGSLDKAVDFSQTKEDILEKREHILNALYHKKFSLFKMDEFSIKDSGKRRESLFILLDLLLAWFRDMLIVKTGLSTALINMDKKQDIMKLSDSYSYQELLRDIQVVANTKYLLSRNTNVKLTFSRMRAELWSKQYN